MQQLIQQFEKVQDIQQKKEQITNNFQGSQGIPEKIQEKKIKDQQQIEDFCIFSATKDKGSSQANKNTISQEEIKNSHLRNCQENRQLSRHLEMFKKVYSEVGPNWTKLLRILNEDHQMFLGSSTNQIKNLFCNSMRRLGKIFQKQSCKLGRRSVKDGKNYLLSMLEIVSQVDRIMAENGQKPNPQSAMQKFKSYALNLCLSRGDLDQQAVNQLISVTRYLGKKMKCYGIFKVKNKKLWKATQQSLKKLIDVGGMDLSDQKVHVHLHVDELMVYHEPLDRNYMQKEKLKLRISEQGNEIRLSDHLNMMCNENRLAFFPSGQ